MVKSRLAKLRPVEAGPLKFAVLETYAAKVVSAQVGAVEILPDKISFGCSRKAMWEVHGARICFYLRKDGPFAAVMQWPAREIDASSTGDNPVNRRRHSMFRCLMMSVLAGGLCLAACIAGPSGRAPDAPDLVPVVSVDLARYAGTWYEIARYPTSFQRNCEGVTAEYTVLPDGRVGVRNTCRWGTRNGTPRSAEAVAEVIPGSNGARLFVNFSPLPLPRGRGNYWIIHLDADYSRAVIGEPSGRFLWYLSRTPVITPAIRAELDAAAAAAGYDLSMLKETDQTEGD